MSPTCRQCGKCCHVLIDGKLVKCRNLIKLSSGKTLCRQYRTRLGFNVAPGFKCGMREDCKWNFPDCEYNKEGQEISHAWRKNE